ncbi:unnamed protein product [Rhodiola kirilowii]
MRTSTATGNQYNIRGQGVLCRARQAQELFCLVSRSGWRSQRACLQYKKNLIGARNQLEYSNFSLDFTTGDPMPFRESYRIPYRATILWNHP